MLYFDNAATTLQKPEEVAQAVKESFSYIGNAGRGANEASLFTSRLIFQTRKQIAELFHMKDGEQSSAAERVVFTMNATESLNIVLKGLLHPGDHVITTEMEHNSVLRPLYELEEKGVSVTIVDCDFACALIKSYTSNRTFSSACTVKIRCLIVHYLLPPSISLQSLQASEPDDYVLHPQRVLILKELLCRVYF